jgi:hypothetical protein
MARASAKTDADPTFSAAIADRIGAFSPPFGESHLALISNYFARIFAGYGSSMRFSAVSFNPMAGFGYG